MTDDMSEGEFWREMLNSKKKRHAENKKRNTQAVIASGRQFDLKNNGEHIIIYAKGLPVADYWPSTDRWQLRKDYNFKRGNGIAKLLEIIESIRGNQAVIIDESSAFTFEARKQAEDRLNRIGGQATKEPEDLF